MSTVEYRGGVKGVSYPTPITLKKFLNYFVNNTQTFFQGGGAKKGYFYFKKLLLELNSHGEKFSIYTENGIHLVFCIKAFNLINN